MRVVSGPPFEAPQETVGTMFLGSAKRFADSPAFAWREGDAKRSWTYREVEARVRDLAGGLLALGLKPGDKVAILADTRPEWGLADLAIQCAGGVTVTLFTTLSAEQVAFQLKDAHARFAFVDSPAQFAKLRQLARDVEHVEAWIALDAQPAADDTIGKRTLHLTDLAERGRGRVQELATLAASRRPEDASTIIYTSGTTGIPKGVVLSHVNCVTGARIPTIAFKLDEYDQRRTLVFLPLAHSLTRTVFLNGIDLGAEIGFGSPKSLAADMQAMRPRLIASAPRIYERIHDQFMQTAQAANPVRRSIMLRARDIAIRYGAAVSDGKEAPLGLRVQRAFYDRLVYSKLRAKLGWQDLLLALSGAAAIRAELLHFFRGAGIVIVEAWGLTETTAPGATNSPWRVRPGTVGTPFSGVKVALDDEGEILVSGPNVFSGYHERPEENAASFVTIDGVRWFRTGDIGKLDDAGYLRIVDRKKEIEVLDTGKKISPIFVEETLKTVSPFVAEACLVGTGRKFAGALVQPNFDRLVAWARENKVAFDESAIVVRPDPTGQPMTYTVGEDLLRAPEVRKLFAAEIEKANAKVADYERIRAFWLVPHVFSIDRDELTITLKKKRRVIVEHYRDEIEAMFR